MNRKRRSQNDSYNFFPRYHEEGGDDYAYSDAFNEPNENPLISGYSRQAPIDMEIAKESMEGKRGKRRKQAFIEETFGEAIKTPGYQNQIISMKESTSVPENQDYHKTAKWKVTFTNFVQLNSLILHLHLQYNSLKTGLVLNAANHKIVPSAGFLHRFIKSISINNPINDNGREMYLSKFPVDCIQVGKDFILGEEHIKFPFAENNNERNKRAFIGVADAANAWNIDDISGRNDVETKLFDADGLHCYIKLSELDLFGNCEQFFNNNHQFEVEIDFNDDPREYLTLSGKRANWHANAAGDERLVEIKHLSPPELMYNDVELTKEMTQTLSIVNTENPLQYAYHLHKFKTNSFILSNGNAEKTCRLTNELQPNNIIVGLIPSISHYKNNHFQESSKYASPNLISKIEFNYTEGSVNKDLVYDFVQSEKDRRNAYLQYLNFTLGRPSQTLLDPTDPDLASKYRVDSQTQFYDNNNNRGFFVFDLTADKGQIDYADATPIVNSNMVIKVKLKAAITSDHYIVIWSGYKQLAAYQYKPDGRTIFTITPPDSKHTTAS